MRRFGRSPVSAGRRDANEPEIIKALLAAGHAVQQLDPPMPDLLVGAFGRLLLLEVKRDRADEGRGVHRGNHVEGMPASLTEGQAAWWSAWAAAGGPAPVIVLDADEALEACWALRSAAPRS